MTAALLAAGGANGYTMVLFALQLGGFVICLIILKVFVWKHIVGFLRRRSEGIRDTFEQIDRDADDAHARAEEMRRKLEGIGAESEMRLQKAMAEGEASKADLLAEAAAAAKAEAAKVQREIAHEGDKAVVELRQRAVEQVLFAAREAVTASMTPQLQGALVDRYIGRLEKVGR